MALTLTADDFTRLEAASRALLSPMSAPDLDAWRHEAMRTMRDLFRADSSMFGLPNSGSSFYASDSVDPTAIGGVTAYIAERASLRGNSRDPLVDTFYQRREELGLEVFNLDLMRKLIDYRERTSEFYNDVWSRHGLHRVHVLYVTTPAGVASLHVHHRRGENPFGEGGLALLRAVLPSFKAGLDAAARLAAHHAALDEIGDAVAVFDATGHELHRNRALRTLLEREADRDQVVAQLRLLARRLLPLAFQRPGAAGTAAFTPPQVSVRTSGGCYTLRGALLAPGAFGFGDALMIRVAREGPPPMPSADVVRARFGLTRREAEVALLLAEGLPNETLAERLFVSPHTARHHTENVMSKLGLKRRLEVAGRLREAVA